MLQEFGLKVFLVYYFIGSHSFDCSPNVPLRKGGIKREGRGGDVCLRLSENVVRGGSMGKHGLGVKVR